MPPSAITGGPIAPPSMVSVWFRPHHWAPGRSQQLLPLQVHFDLKERLGLPEAVMTDDTIVFHEPVRVGDLLRTHQVLRSVSAAKTTKLGDGRFWVIDVVYRTSATSWSRSRPTPDSVTSERGQVAGATSASDPASSARHRPSCRHATPEVRERRHAVVRRATPSAALSDAGWHEPRLLAGDVKVGRPAPELRYEVTATTVVLGAACDP